MFITSLNQSGGARTKLKDLLDHNVDERFYLKSEKAEKLIKQLIVANIPSENENVDTVLATKQGFIDMNNGGS